jgi:hypothetical protein
LNQAKLLMPALNTVALVPLTVVKGQVGLVDFSPLRFGRFSARESQ